MKRILSTLLIIVSCKVFATNHYFSSAGTNAANGLTPGTAKQTLLHLNSIMAGFAVGDSVLFKRGDVFYGNIVVARNDLFFDAYGSGAQPLISGYTELVSWTNDGGGIYHSNIPTAKYNLMNVIIDDQLQRIGRYPDYDAANGGWLSYEDTTQGTFVSSDYTVWPTIKDRQLTSATNWTGAVATIRKWHWVIDTCRIVSHVDSIISYKNPMSIYGTRSRHTGNPNFGYFFQDDIRTLTKYGEWFLNKSTKDLSVYFGGVSPGAHIIKAATIDTLFNCGGGGSGYTARSNISIKNISFTGANKVAVFAQDAALITVEACSFNNVNHAVSLWNIAGARTVNNNFSNLISRSVADVVGGGISVITGNTISNNAPFPGMGMSMDDANIAIETQSDYGVVCSLNVIKNTAYHGISWKGNNVLVKYNLVDTFCTVQDDGAAIYTYGETTKTNREVSNNILLHGIGNVYGTEGQTEAAHDVYNDGGALNIRVLNNTMAYSEGDGIFVNEVSNNRFTGNTVFLCKKGFAAQRFPARPLLRNDTLTSNIFYPNVSNLFYWNGSINTPSPTTIQNDWRSFGRIDSNYHRVLTKAFNYWYHVPEAVDPDPNFFDNWFTTLSAWRTFINAETNSQNIATGTPEFYYNASTVPLPVNFPGFKKITAQGTNYDNSFTLQPFTSLIVFANGTAAMPGPVVPFGIRKYFIKKRI